MSVYFWPAVFLGTGLLLLLLEVFIPSGGLIGLCSLVCLALCLWHAFRESPALGMTFMLIDLVAVPLTVALAFSLWSRSPLGRRFFLRPPAPEEIGVSHGEHRVDLLVGRDGHALTPLRPSGHVQIDEQRVDALAEDGFVAAGAPVRVLRTRSGQVVVRELLDSSAALREQLIETDNRPTTEAETIPGVLTAETVSLFEESP